MQTLGLADSTPKTENRLKSLFWPSIQNGTDVEYLGAQGYWVCSAIAILSLVILPAMGHVIAGVLTFCFYFLGGVGVRERSRYAAVIVLAFFVLDAFFSGINAMRVVFTAVLLSNLRATWIAARWKPESDQAELPPRLNETIGDKLTDALPRWLWPKVRIVYYIFSAGMFIVTVIGVVVLKLRQRG
jgi:hypothetical protein